MGQNAHPAASWIIRHEEVPNRLEGKSDLSEGPQVTGGKRQLNKGKCKVIEHCI